MAGPALLPITATVSVPLSELRFQASRSGGPGGQHVNTSSTRVELWWDAAHSPSLTPEERARVLARLGTRLTEDGQLRLVSAATRSQAQNRAGAIERFQAVLAQALAVPKRRKATKPSRGVKERRLQEKRQRSERKRERRHRGGDE
ncbi:MAG: aminoacyl-tRNA hydrolase [Gemmatimonadetes bacterium]|nr:aminoacyl-tRNA hydrolase [Gemmatimonadota bacterium]